MAIDEALERIADPNLERDETYALISASKVKGTTVYDMNGDRIGSVDEIMLTKRGKGEVAYAVMSFGGFLGIGEKYHPLPWNVLDYDTGLGGYRVGALGETFREAPSFTRATFEDSVDWPRATDDWYDDAVGAGRVRRGADFGRM